MICAEAGGAPFRGQFRQPTLVSYEGVEAVMGSDHREDDDEARHPMDGPSGPIRDEGGTPTFLVVVYVVILLWAALAWIWPSGP
jgi:hypothetical protein